jgi:hypothetical protein
MCRRCTVELLCILGNRECAQHVRGCCKSLQHFVRMCTVLGIGETQEGNVYVRTCTLAELGAARYSWRSKAQSREVIPNVHKETGGVAD